MSTKIGAKTCPPRNLLIRRASCFGCCRLRLFYHRRKDSYLDPAVRCITSYPPTLPTETAVPSSTTLLTLVTSKDRGNVLGTLEDIALY